MGRKLLLPSPKVLSSEFFNPIKNNVPGTVFSCQKTELGMIRAKRLLAMSFLAAFCGLPWAFDFRVAEIESWDHGARLAAGAAYHGDASASLAFGHALAVSVSLGALWASDPGDDGGGTVSVFRHWTKAEYDERAGVPAPDLDFAHVPGHTVASWHDSAADRRNAYAIVKAPPSAPSYFGQALALDGTRAVVGAPGLPGVDTGSVFVYDAAWTAVDDNASPLVEVSAPAPHDTVGNLFGYAVALHGDDILVGAPGVNDGGGAVFVVSLSSSSVTATQLGPASDFTGAGSWRLFGHAVAVASGVAAVAFETESGCVVTVHATAADLDIASHAVVGGATSLTTGLDATFDSGLVVVAVGMTSLIDTPTVTVAAGASVGSLFESSFPAASQSNNASVAVAVSGSYVVHAASSGEVSVRPVSCSGACIDAPVYENVHVGQGHASAATMDLAIAADLLPGQYALSTGSMDYPVVFVGQPAHDRIVQLSQVVNGGWSSFGDILITTELPCSKVTYSGTSAAMSRACGAGYHYKYRTCTEPPPEHLPEAADCTEDGQGDPDTGGGSHENRGREACNWYQTRWRELDPEGGGGTRDASSVVTVDGYSGWAYGSYYYPCTGVSCDAASGWQGTMTRQIRCYGCIDYPDASPVELSDDVCNNGGQSVPGNAQTNYEHTNGGKPDSTATCMDADPQFRFLLDLEDVPVDQKEGSMSSTTVNGACNYCTNYQPTEFKIIEAEGTTTTDQVCIACGYDWENSLPGHVDDAFWNVQNVKDKFFSTHEVSSARGAPYVLADSACLSHPLSVRIRRPDNPWPNIGCDYNPEHWQVVKALGYVVCVSCETQPWSDMIEVNDATESYCQNDCLGSQCPIVHRCVSDTDFAWDWECIIGTYPNNYQLLDDASCEFAYEFNHCSGPDAVSMNGNTFVDVGRNVNEFCHSIGTVVGTASVFDTSSYKVDIACLLQLSSWDKKATFVYCIGSLRTSWDCIDNLQNPNAHSCAFDEIVMPYDIVPDPTLGEAIKYACVSPYSSESVSSSSHAGFFSNPEVDMSKCANPFPECLEIADLYCSSTHGSSYTGIMTSQPDPFSLSFYLACIHVRKVKDVSYIPI